jgi:hypothetical protein
VRAEIAKAVKAEKAAKAEGQQDHHNVTAGGKAAAPALGGKRGPMLSRTRGEDLLIKAWKLLATHAEMFQQPPASMEKAMGDIAAAIDPGMKVKELGPRMWRVDMPSEGGWATVQEKNGEVWVNASALTSGKSRGNALYNLVATYAHNNGKVFIGDPAGLSDTALYRRTENMLSSALRFKTTRHLRPHPRQVTPDGALVGKVRPLDWREGEDDHNLRELLLTSRQNIINAAPEIQDVQYDFKRREFIDTATGEPVGKADFERIAATGGGRAAKAGNATLKRAALTNTLVQGASGEARG